MEDVVEQDNAGARLADNFREFFPESWGIPGIKRNGPVRGPPSRGALENVYVRPESFSFWSNCPVSSYCKVDGVPGVSKQRCHLEDALTISPVWRMGRDGGENEDFLIYFHHHQLIEIAFAGDLLKPARFAVKQE